MYEEIRSSHSEVQGEHAWASFWYLSLVASPASKHGASPLRSFQSLLMLFGVYPQVPWRVNIEASDLRLTSLWLGSSCKGTQQPLRSEAMAAATASTLEDTLNE